MTPLVRLKRHSPKRIASTTWLNEHAEAIESLSLPPSIESTELDRRGARSVDVKISSIVASEVGRYNAKTFTPVIKSNATGNLVEADIGTLTPNDNCIVWHLPEIALGSAKHMLKSGVTYRGALVGYQVTTLKYIVEIGVLPVGETASPTTIGSAAEGSEAAESTTWSRVTNGTPVDVWVHTRQAYYHAGDEKWWAYARKFTYDAAGLLIAITGETRFEVDAPEDCP